MYHRYFAVGTIALILLLTTAYIRCSGFPCDSAMADTSTDLQVPIEISITQNTAIASDLGSAAIRVALKNTSPHDLYLLRWSSPLDPMASAMGVFKFRSTQTNELAPGMNIKVNRRLPDGENFVVSSEDIVKITSGASVEKEIVVKEPQVALSKGESYRVTAEGFWQGIWIPQQNENVEKLNYGEALRDEYRSNEIEVTIPVGESG